MAKKYVVLAPDGSVYYDAATVARMVDARNRARSSQISARKVAQDMARDESGPDGVFTIAAAPPPTRPPSSAASRLPGAPRACAPPAPNSFRRIGA